jgi:uridine kinase
MRSFMDLLIFVECDPDIRLIRRLERDIRERGRSPQSVISQYLSTVRPMHEQFIAPSKQYADIVLCSDNSAALEHVIRVIQWQAHKVLRPAG